MRKKGDKLIVRSNSHRATVRAGEKLAAQLTPGTVVYLYGELGSGKTVLVQGICKGLGVTESVTSPSFVIATEYRGRMPVSHIDLYRLDESSTASLPIDDYVKKDGVTIVEWADRIKDLKNGIRITITIVGKTERELTIEDTRY
jgi:tRNA threonylcarbamoyladenosine biosynthesis protein TsaE